VGDGAIVYRQRGGAFQVISKHDDSDGIINETTFLTSFAYQAGLQTMTVPAEAVTGVALLSDGAQGGFGGGGGYHELSLGAWSVVSRSMP
jgi:hypothetical protein